MAMPTLIAPAPAVGGGVGIVEGSVGGGEGGGTQVEAGGVMLVQVLLTGTDQVGMGMGVTDVGTGGWGVMVVGSSTGTEGLPEVEGSDSGSEVGLGSSLVGAGTETEGRPLLGAGVSEGVSVGQMEVVPVIVTVGAGGLPVGGVRVLEVGSQGTTVVIVSVIVVTGFLVEEVDVGTGASVDSTGQTVTVCSTVDVTMTCV